MENFKFFTDRPPLTPQDVQAHKNFDNLLRQHASVPVKLYQKGWFKAGLATVTVAATGTILFLTVGSNQTDDKAKDAKATAAVTAPYADETPCVKSPNPKLDVPAVTFTVNADRDTVLYYETGSAIKFTANTLLDDKGQPVKGKIELHYREFHNPVEVIAAGIPMRYDSLKTAWNLKSAGMVELTASQNNKPVFIAPGKVMDVQLKSGQTDGEYNVYYLDTVARNWDYRGQDFVMNTHNHKNDPKPAKPPVVKPVKVDTLKIKEELKPLLPVRPRHLNPKAFTFTLDVLESEYPELAVYGTTRFEVIDHNNTFTNQVYSTDWEDAVLKEKVKGEKYDLTLTRGQVVKTFTVMPVLEGKGYQQAMEVYNKKFKDYEQKLASRILDEKKKADKQKQELVQWEREAAEKHKLRIQDFTASNMPNDQVLSRFGMNNSTQGLVTRAFTVSKFGIWNCDKPLNFPKGERVAAQFYDEQGEPMPLTVAYLCEKNNNMMYTYNAADFQRFRYNPAQRNIIWGITTDGKLAYGLENIFAAENRQDNRMNFKLIKVDENLTTLKQVKELMNI